MKADDFRINQKKTEQLRRNKNNPDEIRIYQNNLEKDMKIQDFRKRQNKPKYP
jgi:hypothetical protein